MPTILFINYLRNQLFTNRQYLPITYLTLYQDPWTDWQIVLRSPCWWMPLLHKLYHTHTASFYLLICLQLVGIFYDARYAVEIKPYTGCALNPSHDLRYQVLSWYLNPILDGGWGVITLPVGKSCSSTANLDFCHHKTLLQFIKIFHTFNPHPDWW